MIYPPNVNQGVADLVRSARASADLTQAELAAKAGMSRASLANIEVGIQSISVYQLLCLANALGVEPARLLPQVPFTAPDDPESRRLQAAYEAVLNAR